MLLLHPLELHPPDIRRLRHHLDRVGVKPATAVARAAHHEDRRPVEHAPSDLVHNQTRRLHQRRHHTLGDATLRRPLEPVPERVR